MDLSTKWVTHLRNNHKHSSSTTPVTSQMIKCPLCDQEVANDLETFRSHIAAGEDKHAEWNTPELVEKAFQEVRSARKPSPRKRPVDDPGDEDADNPDASPEHKRRSPPASVDNQPNSSQKPNLRSRARNPSGRQLWSEEDGTQTKHTPARSVPAASHKPQKQPANKSSRPPATGQHAHTHQEDSSEGDTTTQMLLQPETRPISQDQLVAEVKGIYAGLVMVETKCIEVDNAQSSNPDANKLNNEQWQALIALHRTLLHEHHDFFLASQHPSASPPLRRLASKYAMPARMWRHGIHSFLELLRHRLPESLEHMLTFLYLAYSMMALLYETVPAFEETWIECLGDLGRYRMAIEDDDIRDREVWTGVSRHWYSKASDKSPTTGRLYHHLAILARPNALQQLYYYTKSLCVPIPFLSARESIMTLFDPVLGSNTSRLSPIDAAYVRVHGILFSGNAKDRLQESMDEFLDLLDGHIHRTSKRWLESGYFIGISLTCSLLGYGDETSVLMNALPHKSGQTDVNMEGSNISEAPPSEVFTQALSFAVRTYEIIIRRWGDTNILPFAHTTLVFLHYVAGFPGAMAYLEDHYPWKLTSILLNTLLDSTKKKPKKDGSFPLPEKDETPRPLPEDYSMRGLRYAEDYFPADWFGNDKFDEDEKYFELSSMVDERRQRILYLGYKIAAHQKWLVYDEASDRFSAVAKYDVSLDDDPSLDLSD